jgi:RNA polymerase sigma factor (sigma-70 family)
MADGRSNPLLQLIRRIAAVDRRAQWSDGQLLERFTAHRDEAAFAALMDRHGPMVLAVCRGVLHDSHDAEDVFQATFLVLVRRADAVRKQESVGSWLHGVAYRLAARARLEAARRRARESRRATMRIAEPVDDALWHDLRPVIHEEVSRLPEKYRAAFVLCCLEGKTAAEAARLLGRPEGTVLSRLSRARERLRSRLTRRGVGLSAAALTTLMIRDVATAAVPTALAEGTSKAAVLFASGSVAAGTISAPVLGHAHGLLKSLFLAKVKAVTLLLTIGAAAAGTAVVTYRTDLVPQERTTLFQVRREASAIPPVESVPERPPVDQRQLQGRWQVVAATQRNRQVQELLGDWLVFEQERFIATVRQGDSERLIPRGTTRGIFRLDATVRPQSIDLIGGGEGKGLLGIVALEGETLKLCLNDDRSEGRPREFDGSLINRQLLVVLKRQERPPPLTLQQIEEWLNDPVRFLEK